MKGQRMFGKFLVAVIVVLASAAAVYAVKNPWLYESKDWHTPYGSRYNNGVSLGTGLFNNAPGIKWEVQAESSGEAVHRGDLTGDNVSDFSLKADSFLYVYSLDGTLHYIIRDARLVRTLSDINADGVQEWIVSGDKGNWRIHSARTGALLHEGAAFNSQPIYQMFTADITGDGVLEVIMKKDINRELYVTTFIGGDWNNAVTNTINVYPAAGRRSTVTFYDWTKNGTNEMFVSEYYPGWGWDAVAYVRNFKPENGTYDLITQTGRVDSVGFIWHRNHFVDVDNNGSEEHLTVCHYSTWWGTYAPVKMGLYDGNCAGWAPTNRLWGATINNVLNVYNSTVSDVDNDGYADLLFSYQTNTHGSGYTTETRDLLTGNEKPAYRYGGMIWASVDVTRDGKNDYAGIVLNNDGTVHKSELLGNNLSVLHSFNGQVEQINAIGKYSGQPAGNATNYIYTYTIQDNTARGFKVYEWRAGALQLIREITPSQIENDQITRSEVFWDTSMSGVVIALNTARGYRYVFAPDNSLYKKINISVGGSPALIKDGKVYSLFGGKIYKIDNGTVQTFGPYTIGGVEYWPAALHCVADLDPGELGNELLIHADRKLMMVNAQNGTLIRYSATHHELRGIQSVNYGQFDNDGQMEFMVSRGWSNNVVNAYGYPYFVDHDFTIMHQDTTGQSWGNRPALVDLNGDGKDSSMHMTWNGHQNLMSTYPVFTSEHHLWLATPGYVNDTLDVPSSYSPHWIGNVVYQIVDVLAESNNYYGVEAIGASGNDMEIGGESPLMCFAPSPNSWLPSAALRSVGMRSKLGMRGAAFVDADNDGYMDVVMYHELAEGNAFSPTPGIPDYTVWCFSMSSIASNTNTRTTFVNMAQSNTYLWKWTVPTGDIGQFGVYTFVKNISCRVPGGWVVFIATTLGKVYALNGVTGGLLYTIDVGAPVADIAVANVDGDAELELIVVDQRARVRCYDVSTQPDLAVEALDVAVVDASNNYVTAAVKGNKYKVRAVVYNRGGMPSSACNVHVRNTVAGQWKRNNGLLVGFANMSLPALAAGGSFTVDTTVQDSRVVRLAPTQDGTHTLTVTITNTVNDGSFGNNVAVVPVRVFGSLDVEVTGIEVKNGVMGSKNTVEVRVRNAQTGAPPLYANVLLRGGAAYREETYNDLIVTGAVIREKSVLLRAGQETTVGFNWMAGVQATQTLFASVNMNTMVFDHPNESLGEPTQAALGRHGEVIREFEPADAYLNNVMFSEVALGEDSDGDGLPDWWEQQYFGSPTVANSSVDSDGDGLTNIGEYHARPSRVLLVDEDEVHLPTIPIGCCRIVHSPYAVAARGCVGVSANWMLNLHSVTNGN